MRRANLMIPLVAVFFALAAQAEGEAPPKDNASESAASKEDRARQAFEKAQEAFNLGDFRESLVQFKEAYALMNHPALLFNIGQSHSELGEHKQAIFFFETYLQNMGDKADVELANQLIAESKKALAIEKEELAAQRKAEEIKARDAALAEEVAASKKRESELQAELDRKAAEEEDEALTNQWWFWPTVGGASVVAVTAVGATALVLATLSGTQEEDTCGSLGCLEAQ
jgi:tetratricopeptide (TPR) repeat protein